jgi:hypothetical protein
VVDEAGLSEARAGMDIIFSSHVYSVQPKAISEGTPKELNMVICGADSEQQKSYYAEKVGCC